MSDWVIYDVVSNKEVGRLCGDDADDATDAILNWADVSFYAKRERCCVSEKIKKRDWRAIVTTIGLAISGMLNVFLFVSRYQAAFGAIAIGFSALIFHDEMVP
jgi:hypothetical protein